MQEGPIVAKAGRLPTQQRSVFPAAKLHHVLIQVSVRSSGMRTNRPDLRASGLQLLMERVREHGVGELALEVPKEAAAAHQRDGVAP